MTSHDFSSIQSAPKFDGLNKPILKVKMTLFLNALGYTIAKALNKEYVEPYGDEET